MDKKGEIEIRVVDKTNGQLSPDNYDITEISSILKNIEDLLYPNNKKDRPLISYDIENGSVKHKFRTSIQAIIGFSALLSQIEKQNSIDFLETKSARAIENIQSVSRQKNYEFQLKTSLDNEYKLVINSTTEFERSEVTWSNAEFYFYGILKDAGGKNKANIHLDTTEYGYLSITTGEEYLKSQEENLLYKKYGVRVKGKQNIETGEIDFKSLNLLELIDYHTDFNESYLNKLIRKAKKNWSNVDADLWVNDLRGSYEL